MKGPGKTWCGACREITRAQHECIHCCGQTREVVVSIPDAPGGTGNAGPGPHHGWECPSCKILWDGGETYGYACLKHGGREPEIPEGAQTLPEDWTPPEPRGEN